jgi:hypothetical protein
VEVSSQVGGVLVDRERTLAIEATVSELQGVISCRAVLDDKGKLLELHVLADESRGPKQVVRDIETALLLRLNEKVDHKKISVVQLAGGLAEEETRISLAGISYRLDRSCAEVKISLSLSGNVSEAVAVGPNSRQNQTRLVASATVGALRSLLGDVVDFVIEEVSILPFARREAVLVGVTMVAPTGEHTLVGAAFVHGDIKEAVVRATLDALNRRCQKFL